MKLKIEHTDKVEGKIQVSGSKNAALPLMVCSLLTNDLIILENVPHITDIINMQELLKKVGVEIDYSPTSKTMFLQKKKIVPNLNIKEMGKIRASYYLIGAFIANGYNFEAYYPGGCNFAKRPIDYHLNAFSKMGYQIDEKEEHLFFKKQEVHFNKIILILPKKSVGTTINILLASVHTQIPIIIKNASLEPEVLQVIKMIRKLGGNIIIVANEITIQKKKNSFIPFSHKCRFKVMGDRIEAGSYLLMAAALNSSKLVVENINSHYLKEVIETIKKLGVNIQTKKNKIMITKEKKLLPIDLKVNVYPSFPTDLQPILSVVLTKGCGISIIEDEVYPNRITHVEEIVKANGNAKVINGKIMISSSDLVGTTFFAHDLRCGFACIILGMIASNTSIIDGAEYIFRGYDNLVEKLEKIGIHLSME